MKRKKVHEIFPVGVLPKERPKGKEENDSFHECEIL